MPQPASAVPVGTIVAYAADILSTPPPPNWVWSNGQTFSKNGYPDLFNALGVANGDVGDAFQIPDLRGQFLRGSSGAWSASLLSGTVSSPATGDPRNPIKGTVDRMATESHYATKGGILEMIQYNNNDDKIKVTGDDHETRPVNMALNFLIKIMPASDELLSDIPLGAIIPYAGSDKGSPAGFPQWVRCQGSSVTRKDVLDLAGLVGDRFTSTVNNQTFTPPNLTGLFIRGVDAAAKVDVDAGSRIPAPHGEKGGVVGTTQLSATKFYDPYVGIKLSSFSVASTVDNAPPNFTNIGDGGYSSNQSWSGGDKESRPNNAAMHYYINSTFPSKNQAFPVGGIVAIPGDGIPPRTNWILCDGASLKQSTFPQLFGAIGYTWGGTPGHDPQNTTFNIPDLTLMFIRGAQLDRNGSDPEWDHRVFPFPGKTTKDGSNMGPGSYQQWATGMPSKTDTTGKPKSLAITISYPTDTHNNYKAGPDSTWVVAADDSSQSYKVQDSWDTETAPANVAVNYYIKAAA